MKLFWIPSIFWHIQRAFLAIIGIAFLFSSSIVLSASEFIPYAQLLAADTVISVQSNESDYRLSDSITRAEITKIAMRLAWKWSIACSGNVFSDVGAQLGDLCGFIESAASAQIISTSNDMFRPLDPVTRLEMVKILLAAMNIAPSDVSSGFSDVYSSVGDLYRYLNAAVEKWIIRRTSVFYPSDRASRGEAFKIAVNVQDISDITPVAPRVETILIQNFSFMPSSITVKVGTKVIWENRDVAWHTVTFDTFGSQILNQNDRYEVTFTKAGTYQYHCTPHPMMTGTVIVTE